MTFLRVIFFIVFCSVGVLQAQENCGNGKDDDGDGLIDLNDTSDCICKVKSGTGTGVSSIIPNPSFENYNTCPSYFSQLDYADTWHQATTATSDYFNTCGYMPSMVPTPVPDGKACVGAYSVDGYKEYIGANLLQPMLAGTKYTIELNITATEANGDFSGFLSANSLSPIDVTIFGLSTTATFPISTMECPEPMGWIALGSVSYFPSDKWSKITISFTPSVNINAMMIGGSCTVPSDYPSYSSSNLFYFMFDNLVLNKDEYFKSKNSLDTTGSFCNKDLKLIGHPDQKNGIYQWYKNGIAIAGETDTILNVSAKNYGIGQYSFRLSFNDPAILCSVSSFDVQPEKISVDFLTSSTTACSLQPVTFTNQTKAKGNFRWEFGDGNISQTNSPVYNYASPGTYNVKLSLTTPGGCTADTTKNSVVQIYPTPLAKFTINKTADCNIINANFTNQSTVGGNYTWDFGDGSIDNSVNPIHVFSTPGTYDVKLSVLSVNGCVDDTIVKQALLSSDFKLVNFSVTNNQGCAPYNTTFNNSSSLIGTCEWDFGDGTASSASNPSHIYTQAGTYTVKLKVTSVDACVIETIKTSMITVYDKPQINFTADDMDDCYPHTVNFTNTSTSGSTCFWEFGDNSTSNSWSSKHIYTTSGTYDVKLAITSVHNCIADTIVNAMILVHNEPKPVADFSFNPQPTNIFQTEISFTDLSYSKITNWQWYFDIDGSIDSTNEQNPTKKFPEEKGGVYPVLLKVSNALGCDDTLRKKVVIFDFSTIYIPNAFTPNNDGKNDVLYIGHSNLSYFKLLIFDRWGEVVFQTNNADEQWDGKCKGEPVQMDVYTYKADWKGERNGYEIMDSKTGTITVIR